MASPFEVGGVFRGVSTSPFRFALRARRRSSPASRMSSTLAPGREWDRASRAASSFRRKSRETVTWRRLRSAVSGTASSRWSGARCCAGSLTGAEAASVSTGRSGSIASAGCAPSPGRTRTGRTGVTTSRCGAASAGRISAATAMASRRDRWKNRGSTSVRFWGVITLANSKTVEMQSLPSRSGTSTSGYSWRRTAAVLRNWAAPAESPSSRTRKAKSEACPSSVQSWRRSKSARATRKSAMAPCSLASRSARREESSRALVIRGVSHAFSTPRMTHAASQ